MDFVTGIYGYRRHLADDPRADRDQQRHQRGGLGVELFQKIHNLPKGHFVGDGSKAVTAIHGRHRGKAIIIAAVGRSFQRIQHLFYQIVNVQQFQLSCAVIDGDGQAVGNVVAESSHGAVVVGAAPFAKQVGKANWVKKKLRLRS